MAKLSKTQLDAQYTNLSRNRYDCTQAVGAEQIRAWEILESRLDETLALINSAEPRKGAEKSYDDLNELYVKCRVYLEEQPVRSAVKSAISKALQA